jgi:hypothetical protein
LKVYPAAMRLAFLSDIHANLPAIEAGGRRIRSDGRMGNSDRIAKLHPERCTAWGPKSRIAAMTWETPILAQPGSLRIDNAMRTQIVGALSSGQRPTTIDRGRLERQMRELALDHASARLADAAYLDRMAALRAQLSALEAMKASGTSASRAIEWLEILAETWQKAELPEEKSDVVHAIYERIVVAGPEFVGVRLTPAAYSHGLRSLYQRLLERARQDSDLRPSASEADALSAELRARGASRHGGAGRQG